MTLIKFCVLNYPCIPTINSTDHQSVHSYSACLCFLADNKQLGLIFFNLMTFVDAFEPLMFRAKVAMVRLIHPCFSPLSALVVVF